MEIEQISIFKFVDSNEVREKLKELSLEKEIDFLGFKIRFTDRGYEIENEELHLGFLSLEDCYRKINS